MSAVVRAEFERLISAAVGFGWPAACSCPLASRTHTLTLRLQHLRAWHSSDSEADNASPSRPPCPRLRACVCVQ